MCRWGFPSHRLHRRTRSDPDAHEHNAKPKAALPHAARLRHVRFKTVGNGEDAHGQAERRGQLSGIIRLGDNDAGYSLGNKFEATAWAAYEPAPWVSVSARLRGATMGQIDGQDPLIAAPVQTADPENHGGEGVEALVGVNFAGQTGLIKGHRLAIEVGKPLYRNLNGPQLETDLTLRIGWQKAF